MKNYIMIGVVALILFGAMVGLMMSTPTAQAVPMADPTPVANINKSTRPTSEIVWMETVTLTQDTGSDAQLVRDWDYADVQFVIDQTAGNTITLKLQFSNDAVNWTDGATIVSGNTADAAALAQYALFGKWSRIYADVTDSNVVTVTVNAVLK